MQELSPNPDSPGPGTTVVAGIASTGAEPLGVEASPPKRFGIGAWLALGWLVAIIVAGILVPFIGLKNTGDYFSFAKLAPFKNGSHILGVDDLGRDQLALLLWGARSSLTLGFGSVAFGMLVGGFFGLVAGYVGRWADTVITGVFNVMLAVPQLVLALALVTALSNDQPHIVGTSVQFSPVTPVRRLVVLIIALAVVSTPVLGRITRANTIAWSQREFVLAARAQGAGAFRVMFREVLPNVLPAMFSIGLLGIGVVIVAEGGLAVLGIGVHDPSISWGVLIASNRAAISTNLGYLLFEPVVFIFLTVLSLNYLGDVVRARFDVRESSL